MDIKPWTLDHGHLTVDMRPWTLDSGHKTVDTGQWTSDCGHLTVNIRLWTMDTQGHRLPDMYKSPAGAIKAATSLQLTLDTRHSSWAGQNLGQHL